ncbi:SsgA family sporulation/cell division regulator [Amycolatopsis sp. NPDC102389]|uniref:SsgA family sporulation/cell division regulator n=1 Tax=Amycolatopsis sp. NPDC102389 TaxID=3363941 RepID=UPI00381F4226
MDLEHVQATTRANLAFDVDDPWAVTLTVRTGGDNWVPWVFARSLLTDAMVAGGSTLDRVGDGDVQITAHGSHVLVELDSPSGHAILRLPRADVDRLLDEAEQLVPEGGEVLDWDSEITLLVGEGA